MGRGLEATRGAERRGPPELVGNDYSGESITFTYELPEVLCCLREAVFWDGSYPQKQSVGGLDGASMEILESGRGEGLGTKK